MTQKQRELLEAARAAAARAYAPYSGFRVGAALLSEQGHTFTGCNVENASYPVALCAEHSAVGAAVQAEGPDLRIAVLAVVAIAPDGTTRPCSPCGACRQAIREFADNATVVFIGADAAPLARSIDELLPAAFGHR